MIRRGVIFIMGLVLLVAGCGGAATEAPAETQATRAPAATASPTFAAADGEPVTSAEELAGIWYSRSGGLYVLFDTENYFATATERTNLQTGPGIQGEFVFEDGALQMHHDAFSEEALNFFPDGVGTVNIFMISMFPDGSIRFLRGDTIELEGIATALAGNQVIVYYQRVE